MFRTKLLAISNVKLLVKLLRNERVLPTLSCQNNVLICRSYRTTVTAKTHDITRQHSQLMEANPPTSLSPTTLLYSVEQRRFRRKSTKLKKEMELREKKLAAHGQQEPESDDDDEYDEDSDGGEESGDDTPEGYKDVTITVNSLRLDGMVSTALNLSRSVVEEAFYDNKLRVNGETVIKKGISLSEGDTADLVMGSADEKTTVQRFIVTKVHGTITASKKFKVDIRRWKGKLEIDNVPQTYDRHS